MKILFLHPNFPAQFKHIAAFAAQTGFEVKFLCQTHFGRSLKGVERIALKRSASKEELDKKNLPIFERALELALQYRAGMISIKNSGWIPDVVVSHSGWGCGIYAKEIFSRSKFFAYSEWWFEPSSPFFHYDASNSDLGVSSESVQKAWLRNQHMSFELALADKIITPTNWQRSQLPKLFRDNCCLIFDGINLDIFNTNDLITNDYCKITYGTRGMDPMRCFPQFIRAIPELIRRKPSISIEIAGRDEAFYGRGKPKGGSFESWKSWACHYLETHNVATNVRWVGHLNLNDYTKWLKSSHCHVYLSHPFVTSWSLIEAYCIGAPIVTSDIEATREICETEKGVWYADHRNNGEIVDAIINCTNNYGSLKLESQIRARFLTRFSMDLSHELWRRLWLV